MQRNREKRGREKQREEGRGSERRKNLKWRGVAESVLNEKRASPREGVRETTQQQRAPQTLMGIRVRNEILCTQLMGVRTRGLNLRPSCDSEAAYTYANLHVNM